MRIDPHDELAGFPILDVRRFLRRCAGCGFTTSYVGYVLRSNRADAQRLINALVERGFAEPERRKDEWKLTIAGNAMGMASAAKPLKRSSCDRIVREFLDRVETVNASDFAVRVDSVRLFGSYAKGANRPNDIDVCAHLVPKSDDPIEQQRKADERRQLAIRNGRRFSGMIEGTSWAWREVFLFLKKRSRALSLMSDYEWVRDDPDAILIYRYPDLRVDPPYELRKTEPTRRTESES